MNLRFYLVFFFSMIFYSFGTMTDRVAGSPELRNAGTPGRRNAGSPGRRNAKGRQVAGTLERRNAGTPERRNGKPRACSEVRGYHSPRALNSEISGSRKDPKCNKNNYKNLNFPSVRSSLPSKKKNETYTRPAMQRVSPHQHV